MLIAPLSDLSRSLPVTDHNIALRQKAGLARDDRPWGLNGELGNARFSCRKRAASQIAHQLPDNTADALAVLDPHAVDRHVWPKTEYERAVELIERGYDKLIVAQIIGRTLKELSNKLHYEQMVESERQQRRERINELRTRALSRTPDAPRKNYRMPARAAEYAPAILFEERKARLAAEYRDLTSEFFGDPRPGYSQLDRRGRA